MGTVLIFISALFGTAIGSFLNVCIDRLPAGKSLLYPPSHCDACQHRLSSIDIVPVFSYLWLRRRCRYCRAPLPSRPFWVEVGSGILFALTYWYYGLSAGFLMTAFYGSLFLVIAVIDLEHGLILNKVVYPAAVISLIIDFFLPPPGITGISLAWLGGGAVNGLIGGAVGFVFLLIPILIYPKGMGWGDVKMAGLIGLVTGFPLVILTLITASVLGGLTGAALILLQAKKRKESIPFGPFLSIATMVTLLWGNDILIWYLGLF